MSEHRAPTRSVGDGHTDRCALVIEDEPTIVEFLRVGLSYEGWRVIVATDGRTGLAMAADDAPDLIILDVMLPGLDGFEVCRRLRQRGSTTPIIILSARQDVPDRVQGLNLGADDYITKPFSFDELLARIQAVLRRHGSPTEPVLLTAAGIALNLESREVRRNGRWLDLTPTEFSLLEMFLRHPRRVFARDIIFTRIWGFEHVGEPNVVDVHISHLREKLGDTDRQLITAVYGVGYTFRPDEGDP